MAAASGGNRVRRAAAEEVDGEGSLSRLHRQILECRRCEEGGLLDRAAPVLAAPLLSRIALVGQAPGRVEERVGRPFSGRAGHQLFRWLAEAGLGDEEEARRRIYLTSITKCFPGPASSGAGDRRPSPAEVELCRGHLESQLSLQQPWLILAVGQMALERFLGQLQMHLAVGRVFGPAGVDLSPGDAILSSDRPLLLPLPHPSGASRWLNLPEHRALLTRALTALRELTQVDSLG
ncbi:MAG TPA: uracil-DNA glycosylase family protein [Candidatus Dormibacteraeota bacterium]|nr:uracil-DNA glycosylase family protein [Candidatus Dormibacteraeota bacterium]